MKGLPAHARLLSRRSLHLFVLSSLLLVAALSLLQGLRAQTAAGRAAAPTGLTRARFAEDDTDDLPLDEEDEADGEGDGVTGDSAEVYDGDGNGGDGSDAGEDGYTYEIIGNVSRGAGGEALLISDVVDADAPAEGDEDVDAAGGDSVGLTAPEGGGGERGDDYGEGAGSPDDGQQQQPQPQFDSILNVSAAELDAADAADEADGDAPADDGEAAPLFGGVPPAGDAATGDDGDGDGDGGGAPFDWQGDGSGDRGDGDESGEGEDGAPNNGGYGGAPAGGASSGDTAPAGAAAQAADAPPPAAVAAPPAPVAAAPVPPAPVAATPAPAAAASVVAAPPQPPPKAPAGWLAAEKGGLAAGGAPAAAKGGGAGGSSFTAPSEALQRRIKRRPNERFLLIMNAAEGMTSWYHAVYEMMDVARRLGRTLVEPCVRDGRIVTCVPGKVKKVPFGVGELPQGSVGARADPLALPSLVPCDAPSSGFKPFDDDAAGGGARRRRRRGRSLRQRRGKASDISAAFRGKPRPALAPAAGGGGGSGGHGGWAYPLHAYLDVAALRTLYKRWISFDDWFALEASRPDSAIARDAATGRLVLPLGYCITKTGVDDEGLCDTSAHAPAGGGSTTDLRPWSFRRVVTRWHVPPPKGPPVNARPETQHLKRNLRFLRGDASRSMVFYNVWRGAVAPVDTFDTLPPFNSAHAAAVRAWLGAVIAPEPDFAPAARRGYGRYAVWQWRSETVKQDLHFKACALKLASVAKEALRPLKRARARSGVLPNATRAGGGGGVLRGGGGAPPAPRVSVLVSDIPAPNNHCKLWGQYDASHSSLPRRAVQKMMAPSVGMLKYDADHPGLDAGVLSIRDFLLSLEADWFVTCKGRNGAECLGCFRAQSYFTKKIVDMRAAEPGGNKKTLYNWFGVKADDLR